MIDNWAGLDHKRWWGWTDMGPIEIPPQPNYAVFIDRADGVTQWYLTFDTTQYPEIDGLGLIAITTTIPVQASATTGPYGGFIRFYAQTGTVDPTEPPFPFGQASNPPIYEEPYVANMPHGYTGKLFVRNGQLGVDISARNDPNYTRVTGQSGAGSASIIALPQNGLVGFGNPARRIIWSGDIHSGFVGWDAYTVNQTPNPLPVNSMANLNNPQADV